MFFKLTLVVLTIVGLSQGAPKTSFRNGWRKAIDKSFFRFDPFIVNGEVVQGREFPSVVSLFVFGSFTCGGSIINSEWIMTAAHCSDYDPSAYNVLVGTNDLYEGGILHNVEEVIYHANFSTVTTYNDIAVMKVSPPIVLDNGVGAVKLPQKGQETPAGSTSTLVGWGYTSVNGPISNELLKADIPIVSYEKCNSTFNHKIAEIQICAGGEGKDACSGDSGGPLYVDNEIVGIVSWGKPCAIVGYPTVFTRVAEYIDWIQEHTK